MQCLIYDFVETVQIHYKNVHLKSNIQHGISQYLEEFIKKQHKL
jgi:hypothetical protein